MRCGKEEKLCTAMSHAKESDDESSLEEQSIVQIDVIDCDSVRIARGSQSIGKVQKVNGVTLDRVVTMSKDDLVQLLAFQQLQSLEILDNADVKSKILANRTRDSSDYSLRFVHIPDGVLGVEMEFLPLSECIGLKSNASGFLVTKLLKSNPRFSIGDVIVAVNGAPIGFLSAQSAFNMLAHSKSRKLTLLRSLSRSEAPVKRPRRVDLSSGQPRRRIPRRDVTPRKEDSDSEQYDASEEEWGSAKKSVEGKQDRDEEDEDEDDDYKSDFESADSASADRSITKRFRTAERNHDPDPLESSSSSSLSAAPSSDLHSNYRSLRSGYLCHTVYKPLRLSARNDDDAVLRSYAEGLYTQRFLQVAHRQKSAALKKALLLKLSVPPLT